MSTKTVKIVTRARTMSGKRGGMVLTFPPDVAREWIARGWADQYVEPERPKTDERLAKETP